MKDFEAIIATLPKKYRIKNIEIGKPRMFRSVEHGGWTKPVITPLGSFISVKAAAEAHNVTASCISNRIRSKMEGYRHGEND